MSRQLAVVVHGVGVKEAGVSSDLLAASVEGNDLAPKSSDDLTLTEDDRYNDGNLRQLYPCRIKRYAGYGHERIVADFYWGDISNIGTGAIGLIIGILKTVLGIGHAIREGAVEIYGLNSWLTKIASLIIWFIHGPIAAINIVMLSGVGVYWLARKAGEGEHPSGIAEMMQIGAGLVTAIFLAVIAFLQFRGHRSHLGRLLWQWVLFACIVLAISEIANLAGSKPVWLGSYDGVAQNYVCAGHLSSGNHAGQSASANNTPSCGEAVSKGIFVSGARLLLLANLAWLAVILLNIGLVAGTAIRFWLGKSPRFLMLAPVAACGMTFLWLLFLTCLWTAPTASGWELLPAKQMLTSGLSLAAPVAAILIGIIGAGAIVASRKVYWKWRASGLATDVLADWYFAHDRVGMRQAERNRLIVSDWFGWIFVIGIVVLGYYALALLIKYGFAAKAGETFGHWSDGRVELLGNYAGTALWAFGVIGVGLFAKFRAELKAAIDILTDVITYLNDYSWRWGEANSPAWLLLERLPGKAGAAFTRKGKVRAAGPGYVPRKRIKDRMSRLVGQLLEREKPDEIVIVSHSQGTIVATDVIDDNGRAWLGQLPKRTARLSLVTMGSPYTHIHNYYFGTAFAAVAKRPELASVENRGVLSKWINIFRIDDFVGTHVDSAAKWPVEHAVPAGGHTNYWKDAEVSKILTKELKIGAATARRRR